MTADPAGEGARSGGRCPVCGKPVDAGFRPFCSKRCQDVDLHRWLGGVYRIPTQEAPEGEAPEPDDSAER